MQKLTLRLLTCAAMFAFTAAAPWPMTVPAAFAQQSEPELEPGAETTDEAESSEADAPEEPFLAEDTQSFAGAFLAARTADFDSDTESAIGFYSRALAFDPENVELQQRLMIAHFAEGNFEDGLALAEELRDDETIQRVTVLARGVAAIRDGDFDEAVSILTYEGPNEFDQLMNGLMLAWAQFGAGDAEAALATVDGLQGSELFAVFVNFHGGAIAEADGNLAEARERYTAAVTDTVGRGAAADTFMRAVMALATLEAREGDRQAALDVVSTGEGVAPGYAPLNALRQTIEAGEPVETNSESAAEGAAAVLYTVAAALNREGAEETVALYLQFSRVLNPDDAGTLVMLGGLAESLGKPEEAIAIYESVPEGSPMWRISQLQLGLNLADLDRTEEAKAHLLALIEADPDDMRSYLAYGSVLSAAEQYREMADNYDRAVEMIGPIPSTGDWNIFFQRGIAYERLKEWETAEPNFLRALELMPDQPQVLNYLGYSWVDMNMKLAEGMEMIRKAVELRPNDGYIVDSLGWAHYRLGEYELAVQELEKAVELRPSDATINDHLGDAYWRVGRRLEAVFQWNRALTLDPEEDLIPAIEAKIEDGLPEDDAPATAREPAARPDATQTDPDERSELRPLPVVDPARSGAAVFG